MIKISNNEHWLIKQTNLNNSNIAVRSDELEISYYELLNRVKKTAKFFLEKGIIKNNHVAIISENNLEFIIAVNALWFIGAMPVPLNPKLTIKELSELIKKSDSTIIINIQSVLDIDGIEGVNHFEYKIESIDEYDTNVDIVNYESANICLLMFTSGSTGYPKCVQLTFANLYYSAQSADLEIKHSSSDRWLCSLPFYHIGGFSIITRTIISGCSLVLPNSQKNDDLILSVSKFKPTLLSLVPVMFIKMISSISKPWGELKIIFIGGASLNEDLYDTIKGSMWPVHIVYGSTETSSMVTICSNSNLLENGISAGKPLSGVEIKFEEQEIKKVQKTSSGKIIIHSKSVAKGYYKPNYEESKQFEDSVFFSNDLGSLDDKGNLQIIGRSDEVIISGGENISLNEIRKIIGDENIFGDCITLGVKDKKWGESYIIITDSKENGIVNKIKKLLVEHIAKYKMPKEILRIEKIPRNELGKLKKRELQKLFNFDFL